MAGPDGDIVCVLGDLCEAVFRLWDVSDVHDVEDWADCAALRGSGGDA